MLLTKKPIAEIKTEGAKTTIIKQHQKFGKTIGINGCFGSSNTGQMTGFIAKEIVKKHPQRFYALSAGFIPG